MKIWISFSVTHLQMAVFKVHIVIINFLFIIFHESNAWGSLPLSLHQEIWFVFDSMLGFPTVLFRTSLCLLHILSVISHSVVSDCIPPGSAVHGILQARILEWVAISFSSILRM